MDPAARRALWDVVRGLRSAGRTVLLTTHYLEEAEVLCDRIAIMDHGRILELGTVEELVSRRFKERAVRFDADRGARRRTPRGDARRVRSVKREDGEVLRLHARRLGARSGRSSPRPRSSASSRGTWRVRRATLEDVFLDLTGRALRD